MSTSHSLIITGMHRSATSFAANWLGACGLDIGSELAGATASNKLGQFEDKDILEFHEALLKYNKTTMYAGLDDVISYDDNHLEQARSMVSRRDDRNNQWGWKQPRACLFLELWRTVMPGARYLFIYRDHKETVSSLYNREYNKIALRNPSELVPDLQQQFEKNKNEICSTYLSMWLRHNQEILQHVDGIGEDNYLLITTNDLLEHHQQILSLLTEKWAFSLKAIDPSTIFEPAMTNSRQVQYEAPALEQQAGKMEQRLESLHKNVLQRLTVS
jgi:hypothetical protein